MDSTRCASGPRHFPRHIATTSTPPKRSRISRWWNRSAARPRSPTGVGTRWMKWFRLRAPGGTIVDPATLRLFEDALLAVVDGRAEDDSYNALVLTAGLAWREVALLRAYGRYLRQTGTRFSQTYIADSLRRHTEITRRLVELFVARLDPWAIR